MVGGFYREDRIRPSSGCIVWGCVDESFRVGLALLGAVWVAALLGAQIPAPTASSTPVSFSREILPVIEANCLTCHGSSVQLGKLDLRTRESALAGGAHGAAIVPGNAEQSRLYR